MKKKMREYVLRTALYSCAVLGWWGLLYPQLSVTPDTVAVIREDISGEAETGGTIKIEKIDEKLTEWDFDSDIYWEILQADPKQIHLKSGILKALQQGLEKKK